MEKGESSSCAGMRNLDGVLVDEEVMGDDNVPTEKTFHNAVAKWFISSGIRPNLIESLSFVQLMNCMNLNFPLSFPLSVSKLEKEVLEIHEECKEKAKKFLNGFEGQLTLSYEWMILADDWTRPYLKGTILHDDFICLTAHFVDDNWKMKKWILGYTSTDQIYPMDDIYGYPFKEAVQGFEIESKVFALHLPTDLDFNEETLGPFMRWIEKRGSNQINPQVVLLYCCADLFRLMVNDVYSELSWSLLEDVRMLVGWGRLSSTNWNVSLMHLQQAVDMKSEDAFSRDEIYADYDKPSDEDWLKIQTFCKLTGCIYKVTNELFKGEDLTSNVFFHLLAELKVMLNQELANADNEYFIGKTRQMLKRFDRYWNNMFLVLATASVLDPRFKMKYLEFYCSKTEANIEGSKTETVLDYLRNLYARYEASDIYRKPICPVSVIDSEEEEEEDDDDDDDDDEGIEEEEEEDDDDDEGIEEEEEDDDDDDDEGIEEEQDYEEKPDAYEDFVLFQEYLKFEGSPREEVNESELDSYLKEPVMEWKKDFKLLEWWREESQKYPILSRVARDILAIPISRATSWDAYVPDKRQPPTFICSLEPKISNAMMCSKSWLRL